MSRRTLGSIQHSIAVSPVTTRGDLLRGNTVGKAERLAVGATAGMVLESDATDPSWVLPDMQFVSTAAISTTTTIVVTALAAGYDYIFQLGAFAPTDDAEVLWMRLSDDAGVTYEAGAADYLWAVSQSGVNANDVSDSEMQLCGTSTFGNDAGSFGSFEITLINPNASSENTTLVWSGIFMDEQATPVGVPIIGGGVFIQGTDAVDAVQFLWSGGSTFKAQGDITVWRRKRS